MNINAETHPRQRDEQLERGDSGEHTGGATEVLYPPSNAGPSNAGTITYPPTSPANTSAVWGAAAPSGTSGRMRWTRKKSALAIGVAVVVAGGGGAAVYAASTGTATTAGQGGLGIPGGSAAGGAAGGPGAMGAPGGSTAGGLAAGSLAAALHGEYVVSENGSYVTMMTQSGTITALSSTSLTVKSADGVSWSYALGTTTTVSKARTAAAGQGGQTGQGGPAGANSATQGALSDLGVGKTVRVTAQKEAAGNSAKEITVSTTAAAAGS